MVASFAALSAAAALAVVVMSAGDVRAPVAGRDEAVVLLRQAVTEKLESKCDAACKQQKAAMVKQQMEALRKEINSDYHSMTHFGDEAGYVPPVQSIRKQVMDGTLLSSSSDGPAAPPPFSPKLSAAHVKAQAKPGKAFGTANMKKLLKAQEPRKAHHAAQSGSSILPPISSVGDMEKKLLKETPATPARGSVSFLHPDKEMAVNVHSASRSHSHSAGRAKWAKEFNFVKHHSGSAPHHGSHGAGEAKWAKEFSFVKNHDAKVAANSRIHRRAIRGRRDAEPSVVKRAMQKALSFAP